MDCSAQPCTQLPWYRRRQWLCRQPLRRDAHKRNTHNTRGTNTSSAYSYYGAEDGSEWAGKPWRWNCVQGGSWQDRPGRVLECAAVSPSQLRTRVNPRNWGGQELIEDVVMSANITLQMDHIHLVRSSIWLHAVFTCVFTVRS